MVKLKFGPDIGPYKSLAFTQSDDLDTIYIPTGVLKTMANHFRKAFRLSPDRAQLAAALYLEEIYPQVLSHEASHLALGRIAKEEGLPLNETMGGYHNPLVAEIEEVADYQAQNRAIAKSFELSRKLR